MQNSNVDKLRVYEQNGNWTGEYKDRKEIHTVGDWHKGIHCWILNSNNEILLQKRSPNKRDYPNMWHIAFAGHIDGDNSAMETILSEGREELGLSLKPESIHFLFETRNSFENDSIKDYMIIEVYMVKENIKLEDLKYAVDEVCETKYVSIVEFKRLIEEEYDKFIPDIEEYRKVLELLDPLCN